MQQSKSNSQTSMSVPNGRQPNDIERIMISLVIAKDMGSLCHAHSIFGETAHLGAFSLGFAKLKIHPEDVSLEFISTTAARAHDFSIILKEDISVQNEFNLLKLLSRVLESYKSPILVMWNCSSDIPYLRYRAFTNGSRANWLLREQLSETDDLCAASHIDLSRILFSEGVSIPIEQALLDTGFTSALEGRGMGRLQVTACGLLMLAARALWFSGAISEDANLSFAESFQERTRDFSTTPGQTDPLDADPNAKREPQQ